MIKRENKEKELLREAYDKACYSYVVSLLEMWELDAHYGYWSGERPGTIYHYGETHDLDMEEIIYIVENDIEENEVLEWEDYCLQAYEFGFSVPNIMSWHKGCPRVEDGTFERLRGLKRELEDAVEEEKERVRPRAPKARGTVTGGR